MNMIVCIKQVPAADKVKVDPRTGTLSRDGVPSIINPEDKNALEEAIRIRESRGGKVAVISMGPIQAEEALREALSMGADEGILLSDKKFAGSDTWATAKALSAAIKTIGEYDLILCGRQAIDGETAQVGPELAESLAIAQITYAQKIRLEDNKAVVERELEDGYEVIEAELPALVTCTESLNEPRKVTLEGIDRAFEKQIRIWDAKHIGVKDSDIGLENSPTVVKRTFNAQARGQGTMMKGSASQMASELVKILREKV